MKKYLPILFLLVYAPANAQTDSSLHSPKEAVLEFLFDNTTEESNQQILVDDLEYLSDHPVNLRYAPYSELIKIPFVSPFLAEKIILFRDSIELNSIDSLRRIPEMTDELFNKILSFVTLKEISNQHSLVHPNYIRSRSRIERRLQDSKGVTNNKFVGDRNSIYQRMQFGNDVVETGMIFEKDIAERYRDGFLSGYMAAQDVGFIRKVIAGNFSVSSSQGLLVGRNIGTSKGSNAIGQIQRRTESITPSLSADEFRFFRGGAVQIQNGASNGIAFFSSRPISAFVDSTQTILSFYSSGLYRTNTDLEKLNKAREIVYGGIFSLEILPRMKIGSGVIRFGYDKYLSSQLYDFHGRKELTAGSLFSEFQTDHIHMFGEVASNNAKNFSSAIGSMFSISRLFNISYIHRNYIRSFVNPFARPFSERDNISDGETGNYLGIELFPTKQITISLFTDQYVLPAVNEFSAYGAEYFVQAEMKVNRKFNVLFHVKTKRKNQLNLRLTDDRRNQMNYRIAYRYYIAPGLFFSQRFEYVDVKYFPSWYTEHGFLSFIEVSFKRSKAPISVKARFVMFETQSYDSRVYQYETDIRGGYSNPPLFGKGNRWYLLLDYALADYLSFSLRYAETKKLNTVVIGSGDDEIVGNIDNQITLQMDLEL